LDQATFDRLHWAQHVTHRLLKSEAGASVLLRRAVALYVDHLEQLLANHTPEQLEREVGKLSNAARGTTQAIPEDQLIAVPLQAFSIIREEAYEAARKAGLEETRAEMNAQLEQWDRRARQGCDEHE
jgi:hypothetical protein